MRGYTSNSCRFARSDRAFITHNRAWLAAIGCLLAASSVIVQPAAANTVWTGSVDDNWFEAGNWDNGVPHIANQRAQIEASTDLENWPVIKNGESAVLNQRLFLPLIPVGFEPITYARLTIESGGSLTVDSDLRAGEDDGSEFQQMIASLAVAGELTIGNRARFGNNDYMTIDVDVTGTLLHTAPDQEFRIGGGDESTATFNVSGTGSVSTLAPFELYEGSLLTLADDATLTLFEHVLEDEDEFENPIFIPVVKADIVAQVSEYVADGLMQALSNTYSGSETLISLGNGLSYFEETDSITIVAATSAALAGDFNSDGFVDAADYVFWRKNIGTPEAYDEWLGNFGAAPSAASSTANSTVGVPECSSVCLLACAWLSLYLTRLRGFCGFNLH
jgi:hypothetical protein